MYENVKEIIHDFLVKESKPVAIIDIIHTLNWINPSSIHYSIKALRHEKTILYVRGAKPRKVILSENANGYERVKEFFLNNPNGVFTQKSLQQILGIEQTHVSRYTRRMLREGLIKKIRSDGKIHYTVSGIPRGGIICPKCEGSFIYKYGVSRGQARLKCNNCDYVWRVQ